TKRRKPRSMHPLLCAAPLTKPTPNRFEGFPPFFSSFYRVFGFIGLYRFYRFYHYTALSRIL
ncbi:hypothetical protein, partial [Paenibacillus sabuli]|uniref:hypothetical protein n=1 Tax=Paenibacillus sabuli TaxID=2772509 RepID=UPI001CC32AE8